MYKWLKFGWRVYYLVYWTMLMQKLYYQQAIDATYPEIGEVWAAANGLKLWVQRSGNYCVHNQFYNRWIYGHYVNSIIVFVWNWRIRISIINCPGTFHDSQMSDCGVYQQMKTISHRTGGKIVLNSVFKIGSGVFLLSHHRKILQMSGP